MCALSDFLWLQSPQGKRQSNFVSADVVDAPVKKNELSVVIILPGPTFLLKDGRETSVEIARRNALVGIECRRVAAVLVGDIRSRVCVAHQLDGAPGSVGDVLRHEVGVLVRVVQSVSPHRGVAKSQHGEGCLDSPAQGILELMGGTLRRDVGLPSGDDRRSGRLVITVWFCALCGLR